MDFKRLRIAVLSTALLFATNALAAATPKTDSNDSNTESQPVSETYDEVSETYDEPAEMMVQTDQQETLTESMAAPAVEGSVTSSYPWDDPAWEIIQYED